MRPGRMLALVVLAATLGSSGVAWAGAPTEQLRDRVDRVLRLLEDPALKVLARGPERRAAVRAIATEIFDFRELSQRTLARHWPARSAAERDDFVRLFADLLERSYISRIELYSGGERIQYIAEVLDGDQATVRTRIVSRTGTEVPVDYRLHRTGDRWLVYDVVIEGVSLVANYRAQFTRIIQTSSFQTLMDKLEAKRAEGLAADAALLRRASQQ